MRIAITGSSGMIGTVLCERLRADGHAVVPVVRESGRAGTSRSGDHELAWDPANGRIDADAFDGVDAVVNLSGAGIGDKRWSDDYKQTLLRSRVDSTSLVAKTISESSRPPTVLISASGINVYGDRGDELLDEQSHVSEGEEFLSSVCLDWEAAAQRAATAGTRLVTIRSGVVLSRAGGALGKQLPLFKLGLGGRLGSGRQWQSWISLDDEVAAIEHLLRSELDGPVNLCAPSPVTNAEFTKTLAAALRRPAIVPVPKFAPSLLLGREMADNLLFHSVRAVPTKLQGDGFDFRHPTLDRALADVLG